MLGNSTKGWFWSDISICCDDYTESFDAWGRPSSSLYQQGDRAVVHIHPPPPHTHITQFNFWKCFRQRAPATFVCAAPRAFSSFLRLLSACESSHTTKLMFELYNSFHIENRISGSRRHNKTHLQFKTIWYTDGYVKSEIHISSIFRDLPELCIHQQSRYYRGLWSSPLSYVSSTTCFLYD